MRVPAALALWALTSAAPALAGGPDVSPVPAPDAVSWKEMKVSAGKLVVLQAQPASSWDCLDDADVRPFEAGKFAALVVPDGSKTRVVVTGPDGAKTRLVLVADNAPPGPGPGPKPPAPVDPLKQRLKAAFDADPSPKKGEQAKDLAELYRQAGKLCGSADVATAAALLDRVREVATTLIGADALKGVRNVVAGELAVIFPTDGPLTADQRAKAADLFAKLAVILDGF